MSGNQTRDLLLDVSRLVWRAWDHMLPTGIDRVCLQYVERLGSRSQAVIQFKGQTFVLSPADSARIFSLLRNPALCSRRRLLALALRALVTASRKAPAPNMLYLNVGHTGLHDAALPVWIDKHDLRAIYMVHDLIPLTHPQFCRPDEQAKHALRMKNALLSASAIIGNSQSTLDELAAFAAAHSLPMPRHIKASISGKRPSARLPVSPLDRPYFIAIGTIEARKNHLLLLRVWDQLVTQLGGEAPVLVIIGQRGWEAQEVFGRLDQLGSLAEHVLEIGSCDDDELADWIAGARALLMPSFVEGFGLPVIEALELGTPVIASDLPVYRETVGDIPAYLDPTDEQAWVDAVKAFMTEGSEREEQLAKVRNFVAPTWSDHFTKVEPWLAQL